MRTAGLSLALGLALLPALVAAQSLGEVAAQERARRAKEKEKGEKRAKVFTDSDLPSSASGDKPADAGAAPPEAEPSVPPSERPSANEPDQSPEALWRGRAAQARQGLQAAQQAIASAEADVDRIKQDLNPMSTTFSQDPNVLQRRQGELTQAQARAEMARQGLVSAQKAYEDFLEQARRENVPPGWVRE